MCLGRDRHRVVIDRVDDRDRLTIEVVGPPDAPERVGTAVRERLRLTPEVLEVDGIGDGIFVDRRTWD